MTRLFCLRWRGAIALLAAYGLLLQLILPGAAAMLQAPSPPALPALTIICSSTHDGNGGIGHSTPAEEHHQQHPCCVLCNAGAAATVGQIASQVCEYRAPEALPTTLIQICSAMSAERLPIVPRAPPRAI